MTEDAKPCTQDWARLQIEAYRQVEPRYLHYAEALQRIFEKAVRQLAPLAIVQSRPKSIASFAEKCMRKSHKYSEPVYQLTDLCGARVITHTYAEVEAVSHFIEEHFFVDKDNSVDVASRLKPTEFGYRSVHYVVQLRRGGFAGCGLAVRIPSYLYPDTPPGRHPMKAEIQVRTLVEHAWASFSHERVYKGAFAIPDLWERELAVLAANLEEADHAFTRIQAGLQAYAATYDLRFTREKLLDEMSLLRVVLEADPLDIKTAYRLGKVAIALEAWDTAVAALEPFAECGDQGVLRNLGMALCKKHQREPGGDRYRQGRDYLQRATQFPRPDPDSLASLAGTYKAVGSSDDLEIARGLYLRAYLADPTDPYAVSNYLVAECVHWGDLTSVPLMTPAIRSAMQRCNAQIEVGMNLPWAHFSLGMFHLLLGEEYESLMAYAKAIDQASAAWMIETSLRTLDLLAGVQGNLPGKEWVRLLLLLGLAARFPDSDAGGQALRDLLARPGPGTPVGWSRDPGRTLNAPVTIVVGGTDVSVKDSMDAYEGLLLEAFRGVKGTVISGGTRAGVCAHVGKLSSRYGDHLYTIGYIPQRLPARVKIDARYHEQRTTAGTDFSALEALQYWIDLLVAGVPAADVRVIAIDGGKIAAAECRVALALGARVAVVEGSGRAANDLLRDRDWLASPRLIPMPPEPAALAAFLLSVGAPGATSFREPIAIAAHHAYRQLQKDGATEGDPSLADWDSLEPPFRTDGLRLADYFLKRLATVDLEVASCDPCGPDELPSCPLTEEQLDSLARLEHGRRIAEQLQAGWRLGAKRDSARKVSPHLVAWDTLSEAGKSRRRRFVRLLLEYLVRRGICVVPSASARGPV